MDPYIPTIQALRSKTRSELNAAFKRAVEAAASSGAAPPEALAALQTLKNIRICLTVSVGP